MTPFRVSIMTPFFYGEFMQLILYKNTSPANTLNKVLTDGTVFNINFRGEVDIINPSIPLVRLTGLDYREYNYAEIVELGRFYFIDSIDSTNARIETLNLKTDVLATYKDDIINSVSNYKRAIKAGEYGEFTPNFSEENTVTNYFSDVELESNNGYILSTLGVK